MNGVPGKELEKYRTHMCKVCKLIRSGGNGVDEDRARFMNTDKSDEKSEG